MSKQKVDINALVICSSGIGSSKMLASRLKKELPEIAMVCSLEEMGFLDRDENGMYSLGLLFLQYGHLVSERLDIRKIALPMAAMRRCLPANFSFHDHIFNTPFIGQFFQTA